MSENPFGFRSALADLLTGFVREKRALGYKYDLSTLTRVRTLDKLFCSVSGEAPAPSRSWAERFLMLLPTKSSGDKRQRAFMWRQFALYCRRQGLDAWVPDHHSLPIWRRDFCPFIYTRTQVAALFAAVDGLPYVPYSPRRTVNYRLLFRLLYGAGLRIGETLALRIGDCDQDSGVLRIRQGKNRKDRLIPLAPTLAERVAAHIRQFPAGPDTPLFLSPRHRREIDYSPIQRLFHVTLLPKAGLPPRRKNKGPRIHDLRHTFAVHRLENWFRAGENVEAKLPYLAAYMGHTNIRDTYYYLRITRSFFPEIVRRLEERVGNVIPQGDLRP